MVSIAGRVVKDPQIEEREVPRVANMRWLGSFILRHKRSAIASVVCGMIGGVTLTLEPFLVGVIIDNIRNGVGMEQITQDILLMVVLAVITVIAFWGQRYFSGVVAYSVHYDMRKTLYDHMVTLDPEFYNRNATGDLISRMFTDLNWVWRLLALTFMRGGSAVVGFFLTVILLSTINVPLTLLVFTVLIISTSIQIRAGFALTRMSEAVQDQAGVLSSYVQDTVTGVQTLKTFGREGDAHAKFYEENREYRRRWLYFKRRNEPVGMAPQMIIQLTLGMVVLFGGAMVVDGTITLGNFAQFILYLGFIRMVLLQLGATYQRFQQTRGAMKRITPLLQRPKIDDAPDAATLSQPAGNIEFENVSLRVGDTWVLRDISLKIASGSVVAIVGPTGCGKTTLVNLMARVQDVTEGRMLIDGHDVRDLKLDDLRKAIAYVPQSTFLFSQPLHENVRMGNPDLSDDEIMRAVHISRLSNDLPDLPDGMETMVGEKGVMLSGGQKQRVAISRAIARDSAILVLDDALSSVDTQTAADILDDMRHVLETRTSIIIAHRIATVKDADTIIVMDEGQIIEQGTHDELIERGGHYAEMVQRELATEADMFRE